MGRYRSYPRALVACLVVLILALGLAPRSTSAVRATVNLSDANLSWSYGQFLRTGFASAEVGGIQLVPRKVTRKWDAASHRLPRRLSSHTVVTYRDRIFVIGGNTFSGSTDELIKSDAVFASRTANRQTGELESWVALPALPLALSRAAGVVVEVGGVPYLLVMGGMTGRVNLTSGDNLNNVTTGRIFYRRIEDSAGKLLTDGSWTELSQRLPYPSYEDQGPEASGGGASDMAAVVVPGGAAPSIYLFGGYYQTNPGGGYDDGYLSDVYHTSVSLGTDGRLQLAAFQPERHITEVRADGTTSPVMLGGAATVTFTDPSDGSVAVYLIGGLKPNHAADSNAYIAHIAPNGTLTWKTSGNMSEARSGHAAIQSKGQITVSAGTANLNLPEKTLARGYIEDNLTLCREDALLPNFEHIDGALAQSRMDHGMSSLDGGEYGDWGYILGGKVPDTSSDGLQQATDDVLIGDLDAAVVQGDEFVASGKYYSRVFDFGDNAEYFKLFWKAIRTPAQQIEVYYRAGDDRTNLGPLQTITLASQNGENSYTFPSTVTGRYFQFAVTLRSTDTNSTPTLDSVSLDVNRIGYPDLTVLASGTNISPVPIKASSTTVPSVSLANKSSGSLAVLDADWAGPGSFFVDMYVTPPGQTPAAPALGEVGRVYAIVDKARLGADKEYRVPAEAWRSASCFSTTCGAVNWHTIFNQAGTYTVYVMVDSTDNFAGRPYAEVTETDEGPQTSGESNNVYGPFEVVVEEEAHMIFLPLVFGQSTTTTTAIAPSAATTSRSSMLRATPTP